MPTALIIKSNIKQWQKQAEQAAGQLNHGSLTRKVSIGISRKMRDFAKQEFILGNAGGWPPLSVSYARWKGTRGAGINRLTDRLYNSVVDRGGENIAELRRSPGGYRYRFGSRVPYAEFVQEARPFLKMDTLRESNIMRTVGEITIQHLRKLPFFDKLRGAGFQVLGGMPGEAI